MLELISYTADFREINPNQYFKDKWSQLAHRSKKLCTDHDQEILQKNKKDSFVYIVNVSNVYHH